MNVDLLGKNAVVTGGAKGIGLEIVNGLVDAGANVLVLDKNFTNSLLRMEDENITSFQIDLEKEDEYTQLSSYILKEYGSIDILINNAGITIPTSSLVYPLSSWQKTLDINVTAPFLLTTTLLEFMIKGDDVAIINITSLNSDLGFPDNPAYVASKSALAGLTRSLAVDLGKYGIRVNSLAPGYIKTDMTGDSWLNKQKRQKRQDRTCLGRWGRPEDLVGPILFLCSNMSRYVTGQTLFVDGGWSIKGL